MSSNEVKDAKPAPKKAVVNPLMNPNKGAQVKEGTNWVTGMTQDERIRHMNEHEHFWKRKYNATRGTVGGMQNFSKG